MEHIFTTCKRRVPCFAEWNTFLPLVVRSSETYPLV